jgi:iron complex outermembrane receptor protein
MLRTHKVVLAGVAMHAFVVSSAAHAQVATPVPVDSPSATTGSDAEAEIVVTGSRQGAQVLQRVPLAIQAFSGDQLVNGGIREVTDLVSAVPGASQGEQVGSVIKTFSLRGVGAAGGVGDSPIGYYIDNVPFAIPNTPIAPPIRFVDLDRVEVLRGPQGTLYGQGSAGGTIIFHTRDPNLKRMEARGEASISTMSEADKPGYSASAAVSVPLIEDKLAIRISGGYDKRPGYVDIYSGTPATGPRVAKDANVITSRDVRAVVLFKPVDELTIRAQAAHYEPRQDYTQSINSLNPPQQWFSGGVKGSEQGNFDIYSLSVEYETGFANLSSSTSYLNADFSYLSGQDFGPLGFGSLFNGTTAESLTQEIQLRSSGTGPFHWLAGGFFQNAKSTFSFDAKLTQLTLDGFNTTHSRNYSAFGEVSYDLFGGKVVPLFGLRYFKDNRTLEAASALTGSGFGRTRPDKVTYRANISYFPNDDLTAFATVSSGFRSGITQTQFQAGVLQLSGIPGTTALAPDTLTNYEVGMKARLFDGALQLGLNLYRIDFKDLQFGLTPFGIAAFANVGEARTTGIDAEVRWRTPVRGLTLGAVANVNDSKFQDILPIVTASLPNVADGRRLSNTADYNYRIDATYDREVGNGLRLIGNASAARTGSRLMYDGYDVPAYSLYNASIGVRRGPMELSLFGENLADERGPSFVRNSLLLAGPFPRTVGLRLRVNYE